MTYQLPRDKRMQSDQTTRCARGLAADAKRYAAWEIGTRAIIVADSRKRDGQVTHQMRQRENREDAGRSDRTRPAAERSPLGEGPTRA
jgi:hypothetical protein